MSRYIATVDVHTLSEEQRKLLQPGQHITASGGQGRWAGQTKHGTDVAAWTENAKRSPLGRKAYFRALRTYATSFN